ncbi:hypothetical protein GLYMA_08G050066v4 [Glycine max]|nr:hypothetical protein GLYMA_08G050066v4 [Glycine max]KAH1049695.1 hypothetical protein GYH30_020284 [Glycine max]
MVKGRNTLSNILLLIFLRVTLKSQGLQSKVTRIYLLGCKKSFGKHNLSM